MKKVFMPVLFVLSGMAIAQEEDHLFSPEELKADVDYYFEMLYSKHPNPYYYCPLSEFEDVKNKIYEKLNEPLTIEQFSWIIREFNSCMDRHSMIFPAFADLTQNEVNQEFESKVFPIVKIREGKVFFAYEDIQDEIVEINGIAVKNILADIQKGYNWKLPHSVNFNQIELIFTGIIHFTYKLKSPFQIKVANSDSTYTIEGYSKNEMQKQIHYSLVRNGDLNNPYSYKIYPESSIAIFNITTFDGSEKEQFEKSCGEFIQTINEQKIKYVFYDLSMNRGGSHRGVPALNVIRHDDVYFKLTRIIRESPTIVNKYKVNDMILSSNFDINIPKDRKLFVLQGINTESGGDYFCRIVAENKLGVLVGQPTGEPTIAVTATRGYVMPHTKIPFIIAEEVWDLSDYFKSETLDPDIYWDTNHYRDFTENELKDIIKHWGKK